MLLSHDLSTVTLCPSSRNVRLFKKKIVMLCPSPQKVRLFRYIMSVASKYRPVFFLILHIMSAATKFPTIPRIKISSHYVRRYEIPAISLRI